MQNARTQNPARWTGENAPFCAPLATWMRTALQKLSPEAGKNEALPAAHLQLATLLYECGEWEAWEKRTARCEYPTGARHRKGLDLRQQSEAQKTATTRFATFVNSNAATP